MLKKLTLVVDTYGCPNRCKHCWLGHMTNRKMPQGSDEFLINYFAPFFDSIEYYSWVREPDFCNEYKSRWEKDIAISVNSRPTRFELASFYMLNHDANYVNFLKEVGTKIVQLTFFGLENMTDKYVGRVGAFNELINATNILLDNNISVRWQAFINKENKEDLIELLELSKNMNLEERCQKTGNPFKFFVHSGSCDGENMKLYNLRIDKKEVPLKLIPYYLDYDHTYEEKEIWEILKNDNSFLNFSKKDKMVINVANNFDIFFNYTHMKKEWKIANVKKDKANLVINKIINNDVYAINVANNTPISTLVKECGDCTSSKIFFIEDYKFYLLNKYLRKIETNKSDI
ncbi:MAG: radical SAM protein [Bacilli bacterium]|nr:radical SAM protein [Bacilli bacterium]